MSDTAAHLLVYPFPSSGHIIPLLDLTQRLLARGLTITILVTPKNAPLLHPLIPRHASSSLHSLVLPAPEPTSVEGHKGLIAIIRSMRKLHYPALLEWFRSHSSPPVAILSDIFLGWTQHLAVELGIRRIVFSPSGALSSSVTLSLWRELPKRIEDLEDDKYTVSFPKIPNSPTYPSYQISHVYRNSKEGDPEWEFYKSNWLDNADSWGIIFNSFADLESIYIDHVKHEYGHNRVWAVGPVLPPEEDAKGPETRGGSSAVSCQDVLKWLDGRKDNSVVYVCFGSREVPNKKQSEVLAAALERSGVHFVWCVKETQNGHVSDDEGVIPDDFEDRVAGRGFLIRGWAPQVAILAHRAVGSFLTHCGWNSTLEGIAAGVLMLTWPMGADQYTNAQLMVDQHGIGIRVGESTKNIPESTQLARVLAESVDENRPERDRVRRLSEAAALAVRGGSSEKDLDAFVKTLNEISS